MSVIWTIVLLWVVVPVSVFLSAVAFWLVVGSNATGTESGQSKSQARMFLDFDPLD